MTGFATQTRLVVRQLSVDDKSNEFPAIPKLLELMEIDDDETFADWPGAKTIDMIYRHREGNITEHDETMFFSSILPPKVKRLSKFIRDHWKIEKSEHYVLDVSSRQTCASRQG